MYLLEHVCLNVYMCMCVHVPSYLCIKFVCRHYSMCLCACVRVCVCARVCACVCVCVGVHVCTSMYLWWINMSECLHANGEVNHSHLSKAKSPCGKGGLKPVLGRQGKWNINLQQLVWLSVIFPCFFLSYRILAPHLIHVTFNSPACIAKNNDHSDRNHQLKILVLFHMHLNEQMEMLGLFVSRCLLTLLLLELIINFHLSFL